MDSPHSESDASQSVSESSDDGLTYEGKHALARRFVASLRRYRGEEETERVSNALLKRSNEISGTSAGNLALAYELHAVLEDMLDNAHDCGGDDAVGYVIEEIISCAIYEVTADAKGLDERTTISNLTNLAHMWKDDFLFMFWPMHTFVQAVAIRRPCRITQLD